MNLGIVRSQSPTQERDDDETGGVDAYASEHARHVVDSETKHTGNTVDLSGSAPGRRVRFHSAELSVVLSFHAAAPPLALHDSGIPCLAFPDPGDRYFELCREREREREEEERKYVHGVVVHGWTPGSFCDDTPCRVEDVRLRARTTVGVTVCVRNLAFNKRVLVRYTLDRWHTFSEVEARFIAKIKSDDDSWDRFLAEIDVPSEVFRRDPSLPQPTEEEEDSMRGTSGGRMHFAICFVCPGVGEFWDNNRGRNFEVEFRRRRRQGVWDEPARGRRKDTRRTERTKRKQEEWEKFFGTTSSSISGLSAPLSTSGSLAGPGRQRP